MPMRLLTPPQGKSRREIELAEQAVRAQELDELVQTKKKELNDIDLTFERSLSEKGKANYEEEEEHKARIRILEQDVQNLERRRERALLPLESKEKELQDKESALLKREREVTTKESEAEYTAQSLQDKLDTVSEREEDALEYSVTLTSREANIRLREEEIEKREASLTSILKQSMDEVNEGRTEITRQKAVLKGRGIVLTERERAVEKSLKSIADRELRLVDRYKTLQKAITETNLKHGNHTDKGNSI